MKVRCIDAKEDGIPITESNIYTVKRKFKGHQSSMGDDPIPGMENVPGYTLKEVSGFFRQDRFEVVND